MSPVQRGGTLRDGRHKNWFWIDNIIFDMGLSKHALVVFFYLCRRAGDTNTCWPSLKTISKATKCSRGVVIQALKDLVKAKLVEPEKRRNEEGDQDSNSYTLFNPEIGSALGDYPIHQENHGSAPGDHGSARGGQEEDSLEERTPKKKTTTPSVSPIDAAFEAFWEKYPRKVGKEKARQAWGKVAQSPLEVAVIMDHLEAQLQAPAGNTLTPVNGKQFIPHPSSWLRGARWNDEIITAPTVVPVNRKTAGNLEAIKQGMLRHLKVPTEPSRPALQAAPVRALEASHGD
jgi:hypothetical protein